jgi:hypothetical protein
MKPSMMCRLAAVGLTLLGTTGAIVACSSSTTNPGPPAQGTDGGGQTDSSTSTKKEGGGGTKPATDSGSGSDGQVADSPSSPAPGLDAGGCVSDSSVCNSCFSFPEAGDVQLSPNACSSAVGNCIKFTGSVPDGAP